MYLAGIELRNICQHRELTYGFAPGLTGILGRNGTGKTNLLQAIKTSLTGDFSQLHGKEGVINRLAGENEPAFIKAQWEHNGACFDVLRSVRPGKNVLAQPNQELLTKIGDIKERLEAVLGVGMRVIDDYVFVDQGKIYGFLSQLPAERSRAFMYLCGVNRAEKLHELLGKRREEDAKQMPALDETEADELRGRIEELQERQQQLTAQEAAYRADLISSEQEVAKLRKHLDLAIKADQQRRELASVTLELKRAEVNMQELERMLTLLREQAALLTTADDDAVQKRARLHELKGMAEKAQRQAQLEASRPADAGPRPSPPADYRQCADVTADLTQLTRDFEAAQNNLATLEAEGTVACPTCGTPVSSLEDEIWRLRSVLEEFEPAKQRLDEELTAARQYEKELQEWKVRRQTQLEGLKLIEQELSRLGEVVPPDPAEIKKLTREVAQHDSEAGKRREVERDLAIREGVWQERTERIERLKREKEKLNELVNRVQSLDTAKLQQRMQNHLDAVKGLELISPGREDVQRQLEQAQKRLARINQLRAQSRELSIWLSDLDEWQAVVHHTALPRDVTLAMLQELEERTNEALERFECPFLVSAAEDLMFQVQHHDGTTEPATYLSGGQKVVLAVAFRFAVYEMFGHLGMLVLDEPTAGLDADNLDLLVEVLLRLSLDAKRQGHQVLLVTHDQRLRRAMDHVLELNLV